VFFNKDYEQYAIARDHKICEFWRVKYSVFSFKDQVIFEEKKLQNRMDYRTVYNPYKK
jgi:deoxyribodipyrimidine photo-lyase